MKQSIKTWLGFWITSWIITTLGLMIGLTFSSEIKMIVIWWIITIAIADSFSDALGIHISQESDKKNNTKEIWESTIATFVSKFVMAITFILPIMIWDLKIAVLISTIRWLIVLAVLSYMIAKVQKERPVHVISEHIVIAIVVIILTYFVGKFVGSYFGV